MKSQQIQQQKTMNERTYNLTCQQKHQVTFLCANPSCVNNSFICSQVSCKCQILHEVCLLVEPKNLTKLIQKKLIDSNAIKKHITEIADHCIDWISEWRDKMEQQLKYYGLTSIEKKFITAIHTNSQQKITGKLMFDVIKGANTSNNIPKAQSSIESIEQHWKKQKLSIFNCFNDIQLMLCNTKTSILDVENFDSKIIKEKEQFNKLRSFFQQKIIGFKLLYRASENQFSVTKFYKKCSNIKNTLIIIRTEFNKVIGGYTPVCWKLGTKQENFPDPSKSSFIFSLTNADKFVLTDPTRAIQYYGENCGPRFGGIQAASDLTIKDKANENSESYGLFNNCYFNENYKKSDTTSYQRFNGGDSNFFKVREWEVFEIQFA